LNEGKDVVLEIDATPNMMLASIDWQEIEYILIRE